MFLDNQDFDFWLDIKWPPVKRWLYFARPSHAEKAIQLFKAISWCLGVHFSFTVRLREVFFCWDLRIGVRVRLWEVVDTEFSLKKWPGPQTGVHLREVSASGGSTVSTFFPTGLPDVTWSSPENLQASADAILALRLPDVPAAVDGTW